MLSRREKVRRLSLREGRQAWRAAEDDDAERSFRCQAVEAGEVEVSAAVALQAPQEVVRPARRYALRSPNAGGDQRKLPIARPRSPGREPSR